MIKYLQFVLLFILVVSQYDTRLSKELTYLSDVAFESIDNINKWQCESCKHYQCVDIKAFTTSSLQMQGYVAYSPGNKAIVVAFRGSDNTKNWIDDFDFLQIVYVRCAGCLMHNGFYLAYLSISAKMKAQIEFLLQKYRGSPIYVTGHSLGGALATVAALDIKHTYNPSSMKVYTFGQPRVGNSLYAAHFAKQIPDSYRVIHYADMVPHLPPIDFNFKHFDHQIWYTADMQTYKQCHAEDKQCANSFHTNQITFNDHHLYLYMKLPVINQIISKEQSN